MRALRSTLLGLAVLLGVGSLGGCYAGPYHGGYYQSRPGYGRGYHYHHGRGHGHYGRGYYRPGYGRIAVPPPAPACRNVWIPAGADRWGRWQPGHWSCV